MRRTILILFVLLLGAAAAPNAFADGSSYSTAVLSNSPKAYWKLGESSAPFADSGPNSISLTPSSSGRTAGVSGPTSDSPGMQFNVSGNPGSLTAAYGTTLNAAANAGYSVEAWVYATSISSSTSNTIVASRPTDGTAIKGYFLQIAKGDAGGQAGFCAAPSSGSVYACAKTSSALSLNTWHHLVGTVKFLTGSNPHVRLYVDGSQVDTVTMTTGTTAPNPSGVFSIGDWVSASGAHSPFTGKIEHVAFYSGALEGSSDDATIISAHYNAMDAAPVNTVAPTKSGTVAVGNTLSSANGTWSNSPTSYSYQWQSSSDGSTWSAISGATSSSYAIQSTDGGNYLRLQVTATNAFGSAAANTTATTAVPGTAAPVNTAVPSLSGSVQIGSTLTVSNGTWTQSPTSYSYQWQQCSSDGTGCFDISGETSSSYTPGEGSSGSEVRAVVTATNSLGSGSANTSATTVLTDGSSDLIARWDFNESSGYSSSATAYDSSGAGHNLTIAAEIGQTPLSAGSFHAMGEPALNDDPVFGSLGSATISGRFKLGISGCCSGFRVSLPVADFNSDPSEPVTMKIFLQNGGGAGFGPAYLQNYNNPGNTSPLDESSWGVNDYEFGVSFAGKSYTCCVGMGYLWADHVVLARNTWHTFAVAMVGGQSNVTLFFDGQQLQQIYPYGGTTTATDTGVIDCCGGALGISVSGPGDSFDWLQISGNRLPSNTSLPTISGTAQQSQVLTASNGTWSDATSYSYQWQRCDSGGGSCSDISDAASSTYTLTSDDVGYSVRVNVTASNSLGSTSTVSAATATVLPAPPTTQTLPQLSGDMIIGETINVTNGTWSQSPTSITQAWQVCDSSGTCSSISNPGSGGIALTSSALGTSYRVTVTATNAGGSNYYVFVSPRVIDQTTLNQMALDYRPSLFFDTSEHYRPLTLDSFFDEKNVDGTTPAHLFCDSSCAPIDSLSDFNTMASGASSSSYISIWPYSGDNSYYTSPSCPTDPSLRDCGDTSGIYYDYGANPDGYRFLDYWFFYRYNPRANDQHEGDWEGVTVELAKGNDAHPAVVGAIYSAHGAAIFRLASAIQFCQYDEGSGSSCFYDGFDYSGGDTHIADFVASGSHASYEYACNSVNDLGESTCWNGAPGIPDFTRNTPPASENSHDGSAEWSADSNETCADSCVEPMAYIDGTDTPAWVNFVGKWGGSTGNVETFGHSPDSPGSQNPFKCTATGWVVGTTCEGTDSHGDAMPLGQLASSPPHRGKFALGQCKSWYDGGLGAFACSPSQLSAAVRNNTLTKPGKFSLLIAGRHTGTSPGLVQVIGGPVPIGTAVRFVGKPAADEVAVINCYGHKGAWAIELSHLVVRKNASARIELRGKTPMLLLHNGSAQERVVPIGAVS